MATLSITVHADKESDCDAAIIAKFPNPDNLTAHALAEKVLEDYLTNIVNNYIREQAAVNASTYPDMSSST